MRKYVTLNSKEVQEALFTAGFGWADTGGKTVLHLDMPLVYMNSFGAGRLTYSLQFARLNRDVEEGYIAVNPRDVVDDPFQFDGAVQPEKMIEIGDKEYSESTIKAALKEYVK
ncbi:hypothetical protein LCGC14_0570540 [marine sediment metagenome]|uniref:Uncharacterized protein n=1 Tax=marine sediment metagenome TaxID=412755 RepID=A0A0F9S329_9ZZZZ